jgi:hypothetical protein
MQSIGQGILVLIEAMSVKRNLSLMTPGISKRVFQKYTSVTGLQWDAQISACQLTKMRSGGAIGLCIDWFATC